MITTRLLSTPKIIIQVLFPVHLKESLIVTAKVPRLVLEDLTCWIQAMPVLVSRDTITIMVCQESMRKVTL